MKNVLLAGVLAGAVTMPALAADFLVKAPVPMAAPASVSWTGFYLGGNAGGAWTRDCWDLKGALVFGLNIPEGCSDSTGFLGGGQVGYRHQLGNFVFGIEAQADWATMTGSFNSNAIPGAFAAITGRPLVLPTGTSVGLSDASKLNWLATFTGQIGYSFGSVLWYAKGGAAVTDNTYDGTLTVTTPRLTLTATDHATETKFGGVIGTGVEWMFAKGWSVGAEYNHLFMGNRNVGLGLSGVTGITLPPASAILAPGMPTRNVNIGQDVDLATVRLNYRF
jgi:outer membrane immunogenic protein